MSDNSVSVPDKGLLARATGIIFSPGATFAAVVQNPRPASIMFLVCLVMGLATAAPQFTERGREATLEAQVQQIERFTQQPVTPEVEAQMEQRSHYTGYLTFVSIFIFAPVFSVIFAGAYFVFFNAILGGTATFKQVLAIVTHSSVITALGIVLSTPIQYLQGAQTFAGPFNLGVLVPMLEPGNTLANILGAVGFFTLWQLVVSGIGLGVLYRRSAGNIAAGLITIYLAGITAFALAFPRLFGR
jgi:hypothetical protein